MIKVLSLSYEEISWKICKFNALYGDSWGYKCSNNVEKKPCKRGNDFHTKNSHKILRLIHNFTCLKRFPYNWPQKVKYIKFGMSGSRVIMFISKQNHTISFYGLGRLFKRYSNTRKVMKYKGECTTKCLVLDVLQKTLR